MTTSAPFRPDDAPPPSAALLAAMGEIAPVRTRSPWRALALVALLAAVLPTAIVASVGLRPDLLQLPFVRFAAAGAMWMLGFAVPLTFAIVPRKRAVLAEPARASRWALLTTIAMVGVCVFVDLQIPSGPAPKSGLMPTLAERIALWWQCFRFSGEVALATLFISSALLFRSIETGAWRIGAALGAAGGSLAGLFLHMECRAGGFWHLVLGHGGGVAVGGLLGALLLPPAVRFLHGRLPQLRHVAPPM